MVESQRSSHTSRSLGAKFDALRLKSAMTVKLQSLPQLIGHMTTTYALIFMRPATTVKK